MADNTWLVVGSGFAGASAARVLAERGFRVRLVERRSHIAGNAFDEYRPAGVFLHRYGPHLFHTSNSRVADFVTRFAAWRPYLHHVTGETGDLRYPLPPNFLLLDHLLGERSKSVQQLLVSSYGDGARVPLHVLESHESDDVRSAARAIRRIVFTPYTNKMWGEHADDLLRAAQTRVPVVIGYQEGYFTDSFQALPREGYTAFFRRLLDHPRISAETEYTISLSDLPRTQPVLFTGALDELLGFCHGPLPYRSIRFRLEATRNRLGPSPTVNYNDDRPQTRVTDMAFTVAVDPSSTIWVEETPEEFVSGKNEPLYPVPTARWRELHNAYVASLNDVRPNVILAGRMARYQYFDMDQACASALRIAANA
jgi:UDP-galactopyranose mutase